MVKAEGRESREPWELQQLSLLSPANSELTLNLSKDSHGLTPVPKALGSISLPMSRVPAECLFSYLHRT